MSAIALAMMLMFGGSGECPDEGTGNHLLCVCEEWIKLQEPDNEGSYFHAGRCLGYTDGVIEGWTTAATVVGSCTIRGKGFLLPEEVIKNQIIEVVFKHLEENPEKRHLSSASLVLSALIEAWPCPESEP